MAADQHGFLSAKGLQSDRLPSPVTNCHNRGIFFRLPAVAQRLSNRLFREGSVNCAAKFTPEETRF
jgi:hypothetical protein